MQSLPDRKPWLIRLVSKAFWLLGLGPLAIDILATYIPAGNVPPVVRQFLESGAKWNTTIILVCAGLLLSAYLIHREDIADLDALQSKRAHLEVFGSDVVFLHREPVLTFEGRFDNGLRPNGLPVKAVLSATFEVHNRGQEEGELQWHLDIDRSDCPDVFALIEGDHEGQLDGLPPKVEPRSRAEGVWRLQLGIQDLPPDVFAGRLCSDRGFSFTIRYRTLRVGDPTPEQTLLVEGTLDTYISTLAARWQSAGLNDLVSIAG